jgi:hypothetical protein
LEDYREKADSEIGFAAARELAGMLYSVDKDFESKLPENKFLKMFNFVNEDLSLVNEEGQTVDLEGRKIDNEGFYIDDEGHRVDKDGNVLDENGNYIPSLHYLDDEGNEISLTEKSEEETVEQPRRGRKHKATTDS